MNKIEKFSKQRLSNSQARNIKGGLFGSKEKDKKKYMCTDVNGHDFPAEIEDTKRGVRRFMKDHPTMVVCEQVPFFSFE
ncbi:hypothetical protein BKI52_23995 [marine bacterium AO1-C]|nr:hypothetical protein BKI52_23995 [marine bacterium AO1-C]